MATVQASRFSKVFQKIEQNAQALNPTDPNSALNVSLRDTMAQSLEPTNASNPLSDVLLSTLSKELNPTDPSSALSRALDVKANTTDVYTKNDVNKIFATQDEVALKADASALADYLNTDFDTTLQNTPSFTDLINDFNTLADSLTL